MDIRKLQRVIVDGLEDVKAQNIVVFNTEHLSPLFERVIIASGTSNRQTKSLAASVRDKVKSVGLPAPRVEGEANGEWIIVDCGPAVVHVMQPSFRDYYHLEELWGDKPVRMKIDSDVQKLPRASATPRPARRGAHAEAEADRPARAPAAKRSSDGARSPRTAARKAAPEKRAAASSTRTAAPAKRAAAASSRKAAPVKRAAASERAAAAPERKTAAGKRPAAPPRNAVTRTVGVKSASAKRAGSVRSAAVKTAAKKTTLRRTPAKR